MHEHSKPTDEDPAVDLGAVTDEGDAALAESVPDSATASDSAVLEREQFLAQIAALRIKNASDEEDIQARRKFADRVFQLTVHWLIFVGAVTVLAGEPLGLRVLTINTSIILALVGSVSINVLGFFGGVIGYLFPKRK